MNTDVPGVPMEMLPEKTNHSCVEVEGRRNVCKIMEIRSGKFITPVPELKTLFFVGNDRHTGIQCYSGVHHLASE
jgi:hypothetical protein